MTSFCLMVKQTVSSCSAQRSSVMHSCAVYTLPELITKRKKWEKFLTGKHSFHFRNSFLYIEKNNYLLGIQITIISPNIFVAIFKLSTCHSPFICTQNTVREHLLGAHRKLGKAYIILSYRINPQISPIFYHELVTYICLRL